MATATRIKLPSPSYDTSDVVLTLTSDEAIAVKTLVGAVSARRGAGGHFRAATDEVWKALGLIGVKSLLPSVYHSTPTITDEAEANIKPGFHVYTETL